MKNERERRDEIISRLFDNGIDDRERGELMRQINSDDGLREEFEALERAVRAVGTGGRLNAPAGFTRDVMDRLPAPRRGAADRVREFLFKGRLLRWNMAAAMAALLLILSAVVLTMNRPTAPGGTIMVTMNLYAPDAHSVTVAGSFNKWRTDVDRLRKAENGYWTITIPLRPGDYSYMFVVDGRSWVTDPGAELYSDDGFGNRNAVVRVRT